MGSDITGVSHFLGSCYVNESTLFLLVTVDDYVAFLGSFMEGFYYFGTIVRSQYVLFSFSRIYYCLVLESYKVSC